MEDRDFRRMLYRWIPAVLLLLFVAWCTSSNKSRQENFPVRIELIELFQNNGLLEGPPQSIDIDRVAKQAGKAGMNRLLYDAAPKASLPVVKWIVEHGAEPKNLGLIEDVPLLHKVATTPRRERFEYFFSLGLDPLQRGLDGRTVMHVSAANGMDERCLALLLSKGLKVTDATRTLGWEPIHVANKMSVPVLVAAGANLEATDIEGRTALHLAALEGRDDVVNELLRLGASVYAVDQRGRTPLHLSMWKGQRGSTAALRAAGAPSTSRDQDGLMPDELATPGSSRQRRSSSW